MAASQLIFKFQRSPGLFAQKPLAAQAKITAFDQKEKKELKERKDDISNENSDLIIQALNEKINQLMVLFAWGELSNLAFLKNERACHKNLIKALKIIDFLIPALEKMINEMAPLFAWGDIPDLEFLKKERTYYKNIIHLLKTSRGETFSGLINILQDLKLFEEYLTWKYTQRQNDLTLNKITENILSNNSQLINLIEGHVKSEQRTISMEDEFCSIAKEGNCLIPLTKKAIEIVEQLRIQLELNYSGLNSPFYFDKNCNLIKMGNVVSRLLNTLYCVPHEFSIPAYTIGFLGTFCQMLQDIGTVPQVVCSIQDLLNLINMEKSMDYQAKEPEKIQTKGHLQVCFSSPPHEQPLQISVIFSTAGLLAEKTIVARQQQPQQLQAVAEPRASTAATSQSATFSSSAKPT